MKKHYRKETDCANCGTPLQGKFCHVCGQENLELKESFGHMMNHAISDYFHFDHQFFHTLKPLLFKPGKLTTEYMAGKRVQYLHPVKMYIFISLVFFVLLFKSGFEPAKINTHTESVKSKKSLITANKKLDSINKDPNMPIFAKKMMAKAKEENEKAIKKVDKEEEEIKTNLSEKHKKRTHINLWGDDNDDPNRDKDTTYEQYLNAQGKLSANARDNFFRRYVKKREYELNASEKDVKEVIMEGIKHNTPKMMFLLLPLFALLLKIAFWKNKKFYVEHLIYSFHFHCFLFLFWTMVILLKMVIPDAWGIIDYLNTLAILIVIWYIYKSLRVVYHRSAGRTISKMIGLFFSYTFVFSACMVFLVVFVALFD
jgi:hypothetical protein